MLCHNHNNSRRSSLRPPNHTRVQDLSQSLCRHFRFMSRTDTRTHFKRVLSKAQLRIVCSPPRVPSKGNEVEFLKIWAKIFDTVFFSSLLVPEIPPPIVCATWQGRTHDWLGVYSHDPCPASARGRQIRININNPRGCASVLGVLLHEMVHAFLRIFTSKMNCGPCNMIVPPQEGGDGSTLHGPAWADLMILLQERLQDAVGWKVDCGVAQGVREEMEMSRLQPTSNQLLRWHMRADTVL